MSSTLSRRAFLAQLGFSAAAATPLAALAQSFAKANPNFKLGYAAITWGDNYRQSIKDISSLGFQGVQLRANTYAEFGSKPQELKALLQQHKLQLPVFSSGNANIRLGADETKAMIDQHVAHARLVKAVGGQYIQITNTARPKTGEPTSEDLKLYGQLLSEVGKRVADEGITVVYHNHMHQLGETAEELEQIVAATDTKHVKLLLDIAHLAQGGGDPVKAIQQYGDQIKLLHLKDVKSTDPAGSTARTAPYQFVELGQGRVDLPAVFAALDKIKFKGWGIVELDAVPVPGRTPLESATISRNYLRDKAKLAI